MKWLYRMLHGERDRRELFLIAGLGNPEKKYDGTRHNVGFAAADALARKCDAAGERQHCRAVCARGTIGERRVILAKPLTYMNRSGESVRALVDYYKIDPASRLIVISDDIDLPVGRIRIRKKGSAGGHNGLKSVIQHLGTEEFVRIRIGVGAKPAGGDLVKHVLGHFQETDREKIGQAIDAAAEAAQVIVQDGADQAMNRYNQFRA